MTLEATYAKIMFLLSQGVTGADFGKWMHTSIAGSKRNISQVFNAETFIIGLCAGLIGIGLSLLLMIPGNLLIHHLADTTKVSASLPLVPALVLIALSVVLTLIGGLIPSKKAAKSDPVTALRTE